jgi:hypothetical protein
MSVTDAKIDHIFLISLRIIPEKISVKIRLCNKKSPAEETAGLSSFI